MYVQTKLQMPSSNSSSVTSIIPKPLQEGRKKERVRLGKSTVKLFDISVSTRKSN
jgi:hypothetical protein